MEQQLHLLARAPGLVDRQIDDALARLGLRPDFRDRFDKAAAAERDGADVFRHLHRAAGRIGDKAEVAVRLSGRLSGKIMQPLRNPRHGRDKLHAVILKLRQAAVQHLGALRSEEHTSELQSLMRISYAVFCLKKKKTKK